MINHFDFGLAYGYEIKYVDKIYKELSIPYKIYGFEANSTSMKHCKKKYSNNKNIELIHGAISNLDEEYIKLYLQDIEKWIQQGNSVYKSKNNVDVNKTKLVKKIKFSEWIKENKIDLDNSINIIRVNIEGAEWDLFTDLENNNIIKKIHIYMGDGCRDCNKVKELIDNNIPQKLKNLLSRNNIFVKYYCYTNFWKNIYFQKLLMEYLPTYEKKLINNIIEFVNPVKNQEINNGDILKIKWNDLIYLEYPIHFTLRLVDNGNKWITNIALYIKEFKEIEWKVSIKNKYIGNEFVIMVISDKKYPEQIKISNKFKIV